MKIPTQFDKCIICMKETIGDWEHIIPDSIGGRLQAKIVCNTCNHKRLGSKLVSQLVTDPKIRMALEYLKPDFPDLYDKLMKRPKFIGAGEDGSNVHAIKRENRLKIISSSDGEGVSSHDTQEAKKIMRRILEKGGLESNIIDLWIEKFSSLSEDEPLQIPSGQVFVKRRTPNLLPDISTEFIDDRLPVLIAFEFLSLFIGEHIYKSEFDSIREYILTGKKSERITLEHLQGEKYDVFHDIYIEPYNDYFNVYIRLFRWIVFKVIFHGYDYQGSDPVYHEQLVPQKSLLTITKEDALKGIWLTV